MSEPVPPPAVVRYDPSEAEVATLRADVKPLVDDPDLFKTKDGYARGHAARMQLRTVRVAIEKARLKLNEDAQRHIRAVNAEAKRRTAPVSEYEDVLDRRQKAQDKAEEEAAVAAATAERERVAAAAKAQQEAEDAERMRAYQAEVDKLNAEKAKFEAEQAEARRLQKIEDDKRKAEQADRDRVEQEEREKRRAERDQAERELAAKRKELAEAQAKIDAAAQAEREARQKKEREEFEAKAKEDARVQAEADASAKAERDRIAAEKAKAEAERLAKIKAEEEAAEKKRLDEALPDVGKVNAFGVKLRFFLAENVVHLKYDEAKQLMQAVRDTLLEETARCESFVLTKKVTRTRAAK